MVFSFYSKNFDNYKIITHLLSPIEEEKENKIPLSLYKKKENYNEINIINNLNKLIEEEDDKNKIASKKYELNINDDNNDENEIIQEEKSHNNVLKKLHFYDYFFNNVYSKCCRKNKNQELINNANNILYKYLSIDALLYNQLKLENLFKDYNWNDPALNDIQNNKLIIKLKNT